MALDQEAVAGQRRGLLQLTEQLLNATVGLRKHWGGGGRQGYRYVNTEAFNNSLSSKMAVNWNTEQLLNTTVGLSKQWSGW